jgi:putative transposase
MKLLDAALVAALHHGADVFDHNFKRWCKINKVPRSTAYRHRKRVLQSGRWVPLSTRPRTRSGHATPVEVEAEIVRLRTELVEQPGADCGADNVRYRLAQIAERDHWAECGWRVPSRATVHKIMKRHRLVTPEPKKKPKSSYRRFSYSRPRDCYQIDATQTQLADGSTVVVFEVLDDCTRTLVATVAADAETAAGAVTAISTAFTGYGVPGLVLCDNGTAFTSRFTKGGTSRFTRTVTAAGARLIHSSPYHPQTCGKVERHHRTFKTWLATQPAPGTLAQLQALCDRYQSWYNTQRRHSAVNKPPRQAWDQAPDHGGPGRLPIQHDAEIRSLRVASPGRIRIGPRWVTIGREHTGTTITALLDGNHLTVYHSDGHPIGHRLLDHNSPAAIHLHPAA